MFLDTFFRSSPPPVTGDRTDRFLNTLRLARSDIETAVRSVAGRLLTWQEGVPRYPRATHETFLRTGFYRNAPFRACVEIISSEVPQGVPSVITTVDGQPVRPGHPGYALLDVLRRGGLVQRLPGRSWRTMLVRALQDLYLYGNAYWEKVRSRTGKVVEIWRLDPRYVVIEPDPIRGIRRYLFNAAGSWWPIPVGNICHFMFPDPGNEFFGVPPILSAAADLAVDNQLTDHTKVTLQNLGVPPAVVETHPGSEVKIEEDDARKFRSDWKKRYSGDHRGEIGILPAGFTIKVVGLDFEKMAVSSLTSTSEGRIAQVHRVPLILLGKTGDQGDPTRANYREAKEHFWFDTVIPLQTNLAELITLSVLEDFDPGDKTEFVFDNTFVPLLQEARLRRGKDAGELFKAGMISRHQGQALAGIPRQGPDVFYRPSSVDRAVPAEATLEELPGYPEEA